MSGSDRSLKKTKDGVIAPQFYDATIDEYDFAQGNNGASYVTSKVTDVVLQNTVTAVGNGTEFTIGTNKTLTLEIIGTSTSRTVIFEGASVSGVYYPIQGVKLQDYTMGSQATGTGEVWTFEVTGLVSFRARVTVVTGGNVSVKGRAVA